MPFLVIIYNVVG